MISKNMELLCLQDMMGKGDIDWILGGEQSVNNFKMQDQDGKFTNAYNAFLEKSYKQAADSFESLQKKYTHETSIYSALILSTLAYDIQKAEKLMKDMNPEKQPVFLHLKGLLEEKKGNIEAALEYYHQAITENDAFFPSLFRLAYYVNLKGDDELAVKIYEKALKNNILYANYLINLGLLYEDSGQFYRAMECYRKILQKFPGHQRAILYYKDAEASLNMYVDEDKAREQDKQNQILGTPITDFELSVRSKNCLNKMKIKTLGDLIKRTESELLSYKNFGETSLAEIKDILNKKGLKLGMGREEEEALKKREKKSAKPVKVPDNKEILDIPIANIEFSIRIRKCLISLEIKTLGDLIQKSEREFLGCKNFGNTSLLEIKQKLEEYSLSLREEE